MNQSQNHKYAPKKPLLPRPKMQGLGDLVALVAQPIAKVIDAAAGTSIQTCSGCQNRQNRLNKIMPFNKNT